MTNIEKIQILHQNINIMELEFERDCIAGHMALYLKYQEQTYISERQTRMLDMLLVKLAQNIVAHVPDANLVPLATKIASRFASSIPANPNNAFSDIQVLSESIANFERADPAPTSSADTAN